MTVKCLNEQEKSHIAHQYSHENMDVKNIATFYNRSRRTIQRVLVEEGVVPVRTRRPRVEHKLPKRTFMETLKCLIKAVFPFKSKRTHVQTSK